MADFYFAKAESWEELVAQHDRWLERATTRKGTGLSSGQRRRPKEPF
jgi:hypothetical protein